MKSAEEIEKLIEERRYKADAEAYDKALGSFLQAVDEHIEQKSAPTEPKIWRKIVKSRMTKLAAAAVIIIAAYIVIHQSGGSIDITTVTFAQITENMKQMPWLHAVVEGAGDRLEAWFSFELSIKVSKHSNGEIRYEDFGKRVLQVYDPDTNAVTTSHIKPDAHSGLCHSALDFPKAILKLFEDAGEKVIQENGKYQARITATLTSTYR